MRIYGKHFYSEVSERRVNPWVKVWEDFMEVEVPFDDNGKRCIIHHLDQDPTNNDIRNLACVTRAEHTRWHCTHRSEETRKKIRESNLGKKRSEETKRKNSESRKGIKYSEETRKKMSEKRKGIKFSEEHKKNMSRHKEGDIWTRKSGVIYQKIDGKCIYVGYSHI